MGLFDLFRGKPRGGDRRRRGLPELASWLGLEAGYLAGLQPAYHGFVVPKRNGGRRRLHAPQPELKRVQRLLLRRVLDRLAVHPAAHGFVRGRSIVSNAAVHAGKELLLKMDLHDFFPSTRAQRVEQYFRLLGWDRQAVEVLVRLTTHEGGLPQGAPTSPRLSNLVNVPLDARLAGLAEYHSAAYTRYADDLCFSWDIDAATSAREVIRFSKQILAEYGYRLHQGRKLCIRRRHQRMQVTGLVVNEKPALPRDTRRWLRAVEHRLLLGGQATLTPAQFAGWTALRRMVEGD